MKRIGFFLFIVLISFVASCKKDKPEVEKPVEEKPVEEVPLPDFKNSDLANDSLFVTEVTKKDSNLSISSFEILSFSSKYPIDTSFTYNDGTVKIKTISKDIYYLKRSDNKTDSVKIIGIWSYDNTRKELNFSPQQILPVGDYCFKIFTEVRSEKGFDSIITKNRIFIFNTSVRNSVIINNNNFLIDNSVSNIEISSNVKFNEDNFDFGRKLQFNVEKVSIVDTILKMSTSSTFEVLNNSIKLSLNNVKPHSIYKVIVLLKISPYIQGGDTISYSFLLKVTDNLGISTIEYEYPVDRQYHFFIKEYQFGFLKLSDPCIFNKSNEYKYIARFIKLQGDSSDISMDYDLNNNQFNYILPNNLQNSTIYKIKYLAIKGSTEYEIRSIYFRTSMFNTFYEKYASINYKLGAIYLHPGTYSSDIHAYFNSDECIDSIEATSLLYCELDTNKTNLYDDGLMNIIYKYNNIKCPIDIVKKSSDGVTKLTDIQITENSAPLVVSDIYFVFKLFYYYSKLYSKTKGELLGKPEGYAFTETERYILEHTFSPPKYKNTYYFNLQYRLPGNIITSTIEKSFYLDYKTL